MSYNLDLSVFVSRWLVALITIGDLSLMIVFAVLTGLVIWWRPSPEAHSRMLLLASIAVAGPALGRLSINTTDTPLLGILIQVLIPLLVVAHDRIVAKRIHPASIWDPLRSSARFCSAR